MATCDVSGIESKGDHLTIRACDPVYRGKSVILATGAAPRELGVNGERAFRGRGVSYCATCDGAFFRDKHVHVVGGGDSAIVEALFLTRFASRVTIIHRRAELRATKVLQEDAFANAKIDFIWNSEVVEISGQDRVGQLSLRHAGGEVTNVQSDGVFLYIGNVPNTDLVNGVVPLDERGYVLTDGRMRTSVRGIFAAGDCRKKSLRQIVTAVADGATAAVEAVEYLDRPAWDVSL
jgi:thioredoxin reductase (NADPH)